VVADTADRRLGHSARPPGRGVHRNL